MAEVDGAHPAEVLAAILAVAQEARPDERLVGAVRAADVASACDAALALYTASPDTASPAPDMATQRLQRLRARQDVLRLVLGLGGGGDAAHNLGGVLEDWRGKDAVAETTLERVLLQLSLAATILGVEDD